MLGHEPKVQDGNRYLQSAATSDRAGPAKGQRDIYRQRVLVRADERAADAFDRVRRRLFNYDIFPPKLVGHQIVPCGHIALGSTIVQRIGVGISLEAATRVVDVWDTTEGDGERCAGFAYVTLQGHPERGVATFEVRQTADDDVFVVLTANSIAGTLLTRLARPLVRLVQRSITRRAVSRLASSS